MEPDLDDTRIAAPRPPGRPTGDDLGDTVVRGAVPTPPPLVEPPAPDVRAVPTVVVPELPDLPERPTTPDPPVPSFVVRLPDGAEVPVDTAVYIGRRPSPPRIHTGGAPRLVTLPSPGKELSATHLELRLVGDALVASDMRSTNGTVVHVPGSAPRTLIRGESAVVVPGTRIDLGEGAVLDVLAAEAS